MAATKTLLKSLYTDKDYTREIPKLNWNHHPTEDEKKFRTDFWRDYARVLHSPAFRRLKGKTQLFPAFESDFYRCRLTHSLEVAEIGKSIANYLNYNLKTYFKKEKLKHDENNLINTDLIQLACIAHDIGHPPFGHQGEEALNKCMLKYGGFEGNAQTLRILAITEKKDLAKVLNVKEETPVSSVIAHDGTDLRRGLNLTYRSLASILKYDEEIKYDWGKLVDNKGNLIESNYELKKGYYSSERKLVQRIKDNVAPNIKSDKLHTVECQIMDIADDIAYSVYDLEDAFKAGFVHPFDFLTPTSHEIIEEVTQAVQRTGKKRGKNLLIECTKEIVIQTLIEIFFPEMLRDESLSPIHIFTNSKLIGQNGYIRSRFMSDLITKFIYSTKIEYNKKYPALSRVWVDDKTELEIEILKRLTYYFQISSPKLKIIEYRGKMIITELFNIFIHPKGFEFLPEDVKRIVVTYHELGQTEKIPRIICDFISGMTDAFASQYFERLTTANLISMHKPIG